jgi:hypothetical protein
MPGWWNSIASLFPPAVVQADGHEPITVASRFGTLELARQVCQHPDTHAHVMPAHVVLPAHHGMIITRGLQEWACLLSQELPFAPVARLLGWQTHEDLLLSDTTIRTLVRTHGQIIRQAEQLEVATLLQRDDLTTLALHLVPHDQPRRRAGWPKELNAAVDMALVAEQVCPPDGVSWADWDRVLAARRAENARPVEELRHLGPALEADQVLLTVDEVLERQARAAPFLGTPHGAHRHRRRLSLSERCGGDVPAPVAGRGAARTRGATLPAVDRRWGTLDSDLLYRDIGAHPQQDHDSGLVPSASEVYRAAQSDLPKQACQSNVVAALISTVVAWGRGCGHCGVGSLSA